MGQDRETVPVFEIRSDQQLGAFACNEALGVFLACEHSRRLHLI